MRFVIGVVGRPKHAALAAAVEDYESRARRYWPLETVEVREEGARATSSDLVREREGERLRSRLPSGASIVACDVGGDAMSSERFARWMQESREHGRDVALLIGGALGLSESLRTTATLRLSLAPWTLPHELARLVLAEQLYRAGTIVRGEPYHK